MVGSGSNPAHLNKRSVVDILGVSVDRLDMPDTLERIETFIASGRPHRHVVVNASKLVMIRGDDHLARTVESCDLVSADGQSVVWASRLTGCPLPSRVTGIDLMIELLHLASERGYGVYMLGAGEETVTKVVSGCKSEFSGVKIVGWHSGYFDAAEEQQIISDIRSCQPHILFVALGSPLQEFWLENNHTDLAVPFSMGVGGSFDVLAGNLRRAPLWMQRRGLEWLFRLLLEPRRMWKRYLKTNLVFAWLVWKEHFRSGGLPR
jgi:N-acetylglucosaminyldiphosphoundecaprenol N-acetyl-beta-D-mannosaminyltransferase